jgi:hypothetical protein
VQNIYIRPEDYENYQSGKLDFKKEALSKTQTNFFSQSKVAREPFQDNFFS